MVVVLVEFCVIVILLLLLWYTPTKNVPLTVSAFGGQICFALRVDHLGYAHQP